MKSFKYSKILIALFGMFLLSSATHKVQAQKKNKARLTVKYKKHMNGDALFEIKAGARVDRKNVAVSGIELTVSNVTDDGSNKIGSTVTDHMGQTVFVIENFGSMQKDKEGVYNFKIQFNGNDEFKKVSKSISVMDANLLASVEEIDEVNYLKAVLTDATTNEPITGESVSLQVDRLFKPLTIGESFYTTDADGVVMAPIANDIPGIDGNLTFMAVIDSDDYHKVISSIDAKIGVPIVENSTFDERTLWSPRDKTPILMLIFLNLLIFGIWSILIYLTYNLIKIAKS
jgi:hypothetical protein